MVDNLLSRIEELKRRKGAVILAHYYTLPEVQAVADFLGDSLALSIEAQKVEARTILFAGVHFMAETAKVLCPDKKVLIPVPEASCSLADGCEAEAFRRFRARYPGHTVVSYVNTSVEIKAQTDVCCTSSNALKVVESIPAEQPILFAPDRNLGAYVQKLTGRTNMVLWDGAGHVHEQFSPARILELKRQYPDAAVSTHPECKEAVVAVSDFVGSTAALLKYTVQSDKTLVIVSTESGVIHEMRKRSPEKEFIPAPPEASARACNECEYMRMNTMEKLYNCLRFEMPEIYVDETVRQKAIRPIRRMLEISEKLGL